MFLARLWRSSMNLALALLCLVAIGCVPIRETTYEAEFDPPRTYIDYTGERLSASAIREEAVSKGVKLAKGLGFDVEFDSAIKSAGCAEICFLYRYHHVQDIYVVLTADASQRRFRRWFHFSPLDSGSP